MIKQLMDTAVRHSRFFLARTAINFSSAMEHRVNFVIQILGGIALEMGFFFVWVMLFTSYPVINGWTMNDSALLLSVGWGAMDLVLFLTYGILDISALVGDGKLDQYLLYPIHPLVTIAAGKVRPLSLGTIVTIGFMLSWCGCTAAVQLLRFVLMVLLGALIYASFLVIIQSLSFFIGPSKRFANAIMFGVINLLYIPPTVCTGGLLLLTKTVMPIFFIAVLPMQLGKHFSWTGFGQLCAVTVGMMSGAVWLFNQGLRKYESGG